MRRLFVVLLLLGLVAGCGEETFFSEVTMEEAVKDTDDFIEDTGNENGVYMFSGEKENYLFLNGIHGNIIFKDIHKEIQGSTLKVYYETEKGKALNKETEAKRQRVYRIPLEQSFDTIAVIENGEQVSFDTIYGS